jgi:hypothetical protein
MWHHGKGCAYLLLASAKTLSREMQGNARPQLLHSSSPQDVSHRFVWQECAWACSHQHYTRQLNLQKFRTARRCTGYAVVTSRHNSEHGSNILHQWRCVRFIGTGCRSSPCTFASRPSSTQTRSSRCRRTPTYPAWDAHHTETSTKEACNSNNIG